VQRYINLLIKFILYIEKDISAQSFSPLPLKEKKSFKVPSSGFRGKKREPASRLPVKNQLVINSPGSAVP
jgi:hypothetical protein